MSIKTHIADAAEPLTERTAIVAMCGTHVPDAQFIAMLDTDSDLVTDLMEQLGNSLTVCSKCRNLEVEERYIYAIREAGE
jgi:hypothetical protein